MNNKKDSEYTKDSIDSEILKEWDYEKNGEFHPEMFTARSNKKVWWKCAAGHSWLASTNSRTLGHGCPFCAGKRDVERKKDLIMKSNNDSPKHIEQLVKGKNDLATLRPDIAAEWDYEKNKSLQPEDVMVSSTRNVWWKCAVGHSWLARITNRARGSSCPYCAGRENNLPTLRSDDNIKDQSHKKVWRCDTGHLWTEIL